MIYRSAPWTFRPNKGDVPRGKRVKKGYPTKEDTFKLHERNLQVKQKRKYGYQGACYRGEGFALLHPSQACEPLRSLRSSLSDPLPLSQAMKYN